jgi:BMFP domain-containing protein YqiC
MDTTQNFFDAWMNTQSKLVDNLMDTSKKLQESLEKGNITEKSTDLYNNWFDQQKNITEKFMSSFKAEPQKDHLQMVQDWMKTQTQLSEQWTSTFNANYQNGNGQSNPNGYFENVKKMYEDWNGMYGQAFHQFGKPVENNYMPGNLTKNGLLGFIDNARTYMKMFELWQPIYKMMQSNAVGVDSLSKMVDMDKYRDVLDGIFHFMDAYKTQRFAEQFKAYNKIVVESFGEAGSIVSDSVNEINRLLPHNFMDKNFNTLSQMSQEFSEQFSKFVHPYFTMMPSGKEKEMGALMMDIQQKYTKYFIKASEMQNLVYISGQKSIEKAVKNIMNQMAEKSQMVSFDEFYTVWVNMMDEDTIALFGSDTFSKLQGELLKLGLEIKSGLDKLMEILLAPFPVVPRSELDELNATIHDLKTKVRSLEKKVTEIAQEKPTNAKKALAPVE